MKYAIALLCLSTPINSGPFLSRPERMPLRYIYITPTLKDESKNTLFTGEYSYVYWNDGTCGSARSPVWPTPQENYADMVQIKSVVLSPPDIPKQLSILYALTKITPDGKMNLEKEDSIEVDLDTLPQTHLIPHIPKMLTLVISQKAIRHK